MFNYQGEENKKEPEQPKGQKLCPEMSQVVPVQNPVTGEIEMVMQAAPCAGEQCGQWYGPQGECSILTFTCSLFRLADALDSIERIMTSGGHSHN